MSFEMLTERSPRIKLREIGTASLVYLFFLGLAVISSYARGPGLLRSVIWDPVTLFAFYPGDQTVVRQLAAGYLPLWDPHRGLGTSNLLPTGGSFDTPLKLPAYLFNAEWSWEFYLLLRFLLAGLFCFMAGRETGLRFRGALLAGLSFMLCGYFRIFHNQESMNVEVLFALFFYLIARLARRPTLGGYVSAILVGHFLTNNPESTAYALVYTCAFFLWRRLPLLAGRARPLRNALGLALVPAALFPTGFLLRSEAMLSFLEYHHHSWIFHPRGLGELALPLSSAIGVVTPLFDYWLAGPPRLDQTLFAQLSPVPAYLGIITFILLGLTMLHLRRLSTPGLFFAASALVLAGLVFGLPPFSLLAKLPLFRFFQNFRYCQPFLAFSAAMLAGRGLELILSRQIRSGLATALVVLLCLWIMAHLFIFRHQLAHADLVKIGLAAGGVTAVSLAGLTIWLLRCFPSRQAAILAWSLLAAAGFELALYFNLARPLFGPDAFNITEPAGARFLAREEQGLFRIFGADQRILHPNLAGLSGLSDLRNHVPLETLDYARFMSAANGWNSPEQMMVNFLKDGKFYFDIEWERWPAGLLSLVNVRYVLAYGHPYSRPAD
jgi:hypothetical protein